MPKLILIEKVIVLKSLSIFSDTPEVLPIPKAGHESIDTNINDDNGASIFEKTAIASEGAYPKIIR